MKNKTYKVIGGCALLLFALFMVFSRNALNVPKAAAASSAPTISLTPTYDPNDLNTPQVIGEAISISSPGPFTQDFQYQICWKPADNIRYAPGLPGAATTCVWSPWASASAQNYSLAQWSQWMWPGMEDEAKHSSAPWPPGSLGQPGFSSLGSPGSVPSNIWINAVATQPLPAGKELVNVSVGIQLVELVGGTLGSIPPNYSCDPVMTPAGGGMSPVAESWTLGNCLNGPGSATPDALQISVSGSFRGASVSGSMPSQMSPGQTVTNSTITVKNIGTTAITPSSWKETDLGQGTGSCTVDTNGDGIPDQVATSTSGGTASCTIQVDLTANNFAFTYNGNSFTTPATVPYELTNVTKTSTQIPARTIIIYGHRFMLFPNCVPGAGSGPSCVYSINTVPAHVDVSYNAPSMTGYPFLSPGQSATFSINPLTAPSAAGSYTETWTLSDSQGAVPGGTYQTTINVGGVPQSAGTITVASEDSQATSVSVPATWSFINYPKPQDNPCSGHGESCDNQTAATYTNLDMGSYQLCSQLDLNYCHPTQTGLWSFNSIKMIPIARRSNDWFIALANFGKGIISPEAMAMSSCGQFGSNPPSSCPSGASASSLTLFPATPEVSYVILWNPIAAMSLSQNTWTPTGASGGSAATQQVTVSNTGAPGSTLTWSASSNASWLSVSPSSDSTGLTNGASGNASENVIVTANPAVAGLSVGQHTGIISFYGTSQPGANSLPQEVLTVTFTVTKAGSGNGTITGVSASCSPSTVYTNGASTCTANVSGNGGFNPTVNWSASVGTIDAGGHYTAPGTTGTATITATSRQDSTKSIQTTITITNPPLPTCAPGDASCQVTCSSPTLTANPSSIVVPESSNLSYGCTNVTQCNLSGGDVNVTNPATPLASPGTISGTATTTPSVTTTYTLTCKNGATSNPPTSYTTQVTVGGSSRCEQNPNGVGCPAQ